MAVSEASVVMDRVMSRRGWTSMVALEMAVFTWFTEVIISGVMVKSFLALDRESLDVELGGGEGELLDGVDLLREGADPLRVQGVTQEGHGGLG